MIDDEAKRRMTLQDVLAKARASSAKAAERGWVKPTVQPLGTACPECSGTGYFVGRAGEYAQARLCKCRERCPLCQDTRYVLKVVDGYEVAAPCECAALVTRIATYNATQIPAGYADKQINTLGPDDVHGFSDRGLESLKRAKAAMHRYRVSLDTGQMKGLLLIGGLGLGKTHLVCGLLSYLALERGIRCRFVDYHDLMARLRATFDDRSGDERSSEIIEGLVQTQILVIDDLGKGQGTNWELSIIDQLVTRRYNAGRIILATTNYLPEELLEKRDSQGLLERRRRDLGESLEERIGERLVSRLRQACDFQFMEGKDYRAEVQKRPR